VWGAEAEAEPEPAPAGVPRHAAIAARLQEAVSIGAVTDLHAIAGELAAGDAADAALGRRLARLAGEFDFAGVSALAASLAAGQGAGNGD
jgi:hypothetical protein